MWQSLFSSLFFTADNWGQFCRANLLSTGSGQALCKRHKDKGPGLSLRAESVRTPRPSGSQDVHPAGITESPSVNTSWANCHCLRWNNKTKTKMVTEAQGTLRCVFFRKRSNFRKKPVNKCGTAPFLLKGIISLHLNLDIFVFSYIGRVSYCHCPMTKILNVPWAKNKPNICIGTMCIYFVGVHNTKLLVCRRGIWIHKKTA